MNLQRVGEDRLLAQILPHLPHGRKVIAGAGDDCAVVDLGGKGELTLLKTDCVVEGVHFSAKADAESIGWKAMARTLSDFAAMSGVPQFALVTLIAPRTTKVIWVKKLYRGLNKAAQKFGVMIVGGETSSTRGPIVVSVSAIGFTEKDRWVSRAAGKVGDALFVTGRLGGSMRSHHLRFTPRIAESRWLTKNFSIHAMMDLSDGLGADLPRLARASKVGFKIDVKKLPRAPGATIDNAINDGEDYELLFAISPRESDRLQKKWRKKFPKLPLTRIGVLSPQSAIRNPRFPGGYVHFQ
jgi:thiamine-monophosphate kinase